MTNINKITKSEYPELWDLIIDDYETVSEEYRKGSSFFVTTLHTINEEDFPDNPELHGLWLSDCWIRDAEYGDGEPYSLYRVNKVEKVVTQTVVDYVRVEDDI